MNAQHSIDKIEERRLKWFGYLENMGSVRIRNIYSRVECREQVKGKNLGNSGCMDSEEI